jgi:hypothetical protein
LLDLDSLSCARQPPPGLTNSRVWICRSTAVVGPLRSTLAPTVGSPVVIIVFLPHLLETAFEWIVPFAGGTQYVYQAAGVTTGFAQAARTSTSPSAPLANAHLQPV